MLNLPMRMPVVVLNGLQWVPVEAFVVGWGEFVRWFRKAGSGTYSSQKLVQN